jgi:hypothetical protein
MPLIFYGIISFFFFFFLSIFSFIVIDIYLCLCYVYVILSVYVYISVFVFVIVIINKNPLNIYRMRNMHYLTNCSQYCWGTVEGHPKLPVLDGIYFKNRIVISNSKTGLSMAYIYGVLWKSL